VGWILTAYSLVQNIVMPVAGRLGESFGLLRFFFLSVVLFTVGSMLCALAPNIYLLIIARVVQALGGRGIFAAFSRDRFAPVSRIPPANEAN